MQVGGIGNCWYTLFIAARFLEAEDYDSDEDPRAAAAKECGLDAWVVQPRATAYDQDVDESKRIVLFGKRLALIGDGGADAAHVPAEDLIRIIDDTRRRLRKAGIREQPRLWAHCDIDLGD